jgi:hypothetical protein
VPWDRATALRLRELAAHQDKFTTVVNVLDGMAADRAEADRTSELISTFLADLAPHHWEHLRSTGAGLREL